MIQCGDVGCSQPGRSADLPAYPIWHAERVSSAPPHLLVLGVFQPVQLDPAFSRHLAHDARPGGGLPPKFHGPPQAISRSDIEMLAVLVTVGAVHDGS